MEQMKDLIVTLRSANTRMVYARIIVLKHPRYLQLVSSAIDFTD